VREPSIRESARGLFFEQDGGATQSDAGGFGRYSRRPDAPVLTYLGDDLWCSSSAAGTIGHPMAFRRRAANAWRSKPGARSQTKERISERKPGNSGDGRECQSRSAHADTGKTDFQYASTDTVDFVTTARLW